MAYEQRGKGVMAFVDDKAIAYATDHTLSINTQISTDGQTKDEALGAYGDFDRNEWEVDCNSVMGVGSGENYTTLVAKMLGQQWDDDDSEVLEMVFDAVDPGEVEDAVPAGGWAAGADTSFFPASTGDAYIEELSFSAGSEGYATMSAKFIGVGTLS